MAPGKRKASNKPKGVTKPKGPGQFKKSISEKKIPTNPFELKFNRPKHNVLGVKKHMVGAPGASKKNAIANRRKTLQVEYKNMGKINQIIDKRFGERDATMTVEEKAAKRFALQRALSAKAEKKSKFLLEDDDDEELALTHKGQNVLDIKVDRHERLGSDDEEEDQDTGNLGRSLVSAVNFGGGWMRPDGDEEAERAYSSKPTNRKDMINDLIARSKLIKQEKQTAKDEIDDATENLDEKWKALLQSGSVKGFQPGVNKHATAGIQSDSYDEFFRELQMNGGKRADPQDKLKSAKELASLEKQRLEELERKRVARMNPDMPALPIMRFEEAEDADDDEEEESDESGDEVEIEDFDAMGASDGEDEDDEGFGLKPQITATKAKDSVQTDDPLLPYVFDLPQSYKQLAAVLEGHTAHDQVVVIERITKCHHPSLKEGNKQKLSKLFVHLLRHYDSIASSESGAAQTKTLGELLKALYKLMKYDVDYAARAMRALLMNKKKKRRGSHDSPSFGLIAFFQAVALLFPVSDKFHPVCSPSMAFAMEVISTSHVTSLNDCSRIILLCTVLSDWVADSKRYLPEVIAFLRGVLLMAVDNSTDEQFPSTAFPISEPHRRMLYVTSKVTSQGVEPISLSKVFSSEKESSDALKAAVVRNTIGALNRFMMIYSSAHAATFGAIFKPFESLVERLPKDHYPEALQTEIAGFLLALQSECQKRSAVKHLHRVNNTIKMIEMLEPHIEINFDPERARRRDNKNDPNAERKKLQHKVKREHRGAVRELRKDAQFVARHKMVDRMRVGREREEKTKKILHDLQFQESEHKKREYAKKYHRN